MPCIHGVDIMKLTKLFGLVHIILNSSNLDGNILEMVDEDFYKMVVRMLTLEVVVVSPTYSEGMREGKLYSNSR